VYVCARVYACAQSCMRVRSHARAGAFILEFWLFPINRLRKNKKKLTLDKALPTW